MTDLAILAACVLACIAVAVTVRGLCKESRDAGYSAGYRAGTYDALKTDISASKTAFPHKS